MASAASFMMVLLQGAISGTSPWKAPATSLDVRADQRWSNCRNSSTMLPRPSGPSLTRYSSMWKASFSGTSGPTWTMAVDELRPFMRMYCPLYSTLAHMNGIASLLRRMASSFLTRDWSSSRSTGEFGSPACSAANSSAFALGRMKDSDLTSSQLIDALSYRLPTGLPAGPSGGAGAVSFASFFRRYVGGHVLQHLLDPTRQRTERAQADLDPGF